MSKLLKKTFTVSVVALTIMWSVGIAALIPTVVNAVDCPALVAGDIWMVNDKSSTAVWTLDSNLKKVYFPTEDVYKTWLAKADGSADWSVIKKIAPSCVISYLDPATKPFGVNYFPGNVYQTQMTKQYFVVESGNKATEVTETVLKDVYGTNWKSQVKQFNDFFPSATIVSNGTKVETAKLFEGMLVKKTTGDTYQVVAGKLSKVDGTLSGAAAKAVRTVSDTLFATGEVATTTVTPASVTANPIQATVTTGTGTGTGTVVTGGNLSVSLAADTPAGGYALATASRVPFLKVVFTAGTADVTIDQFKVKRGGSPATDVDFSTINVVTPEGNLLNDSGKTLNSDHEVTFTENLTIKAGESKTYTIVGNMASILLMVGGNVPKLSVTAVTLVGTGTVTGLPVEGNALTTNDSLTLSAATFAEGSVVGTVTKQVGATNILVASIKLTNATTGSDAKKIALEKLMLYNSGTVADSDLATFKLKYNNATLATASMVSKYVNFDLSACSVDDCVLDKGYDRTYDVYVDLAAGSGRTVNLDLQYATHAAVKDVTNGIYITPTDSATALGNTITISQGKINVTKVNNVPSGNIAKNASNVELASWNFNVIGEPIDVRTLVFKITPTTLSKAEMLDSLILYNAAGTAVIGGVDGVGASAATVGWATSTDTFTLNPGDNVLTLKGSVDNLPTAGDTFQIGIEMTGTTNFIARGVNSSLDITLGTYATPQSVVAANTKTIQTSSLVVTTLSAPAAQSFAPGINSVLFGRVMLDASASTEDVKVSQFKATVSTTGSHTMDVQNIRLWVDKDGDSYNGAGTAVALAEVENGDSSSAGAGVDEALTWNLSGDDQFLIKAGKKVVVEIRGDIAGGATAGTVQIQTNTADDVTATGQTTKSQVTETIDTGASSNVMTIGAAGGQVMVSLSTSNPSAKLLAGGTTVTIASFNFLATTTEDVEMDYLYLTQLNASVTASTSYKDYDEIWFEDTTGNEIAGTRMSPTSTKPLIDFTENAFIVKTSDSSGKTLNLKAKLATIGTNYNGTSGHYVGYKINVQGDVVAKGDLSGSGALEYLSPVSVPTGLTSYVYKAYPVFSRETVSSGKLVNGTRDLLKFKITAVNGDIGLAGFTFDITTTTASLTASTLYVYDVTEATEVKVNDSGSSGIYNYTLTGAVWNTTSSDWATEYAAGEMVVAVGTPRTYVVRGNISGSTTGAAVSTGVAGDAAVLNHGATLMLSQLNANVAPSNNDFIWTDRNASGHSSASTDFTNGYLVSGLSSTTSTQETVAY